MKKNEYIKVSNVLNSQTSNLLFEYIKETAKRYEKIKTLCPDINLEDKFDEIMDPRIGPIGFSKYGDMLTETLMLRLLSIIEKEIDLKLIPTYSFFRLYKKGDKLPKHTDRPQCEISVSLCVGYIGEEQWPLFIQGTPVYLEPGDLAIYRGIELVHWREPLEGEMQAQIFLHYNDIKGPYRDRYLYDGKPYIGWPKGIQASRASRFRHHQQ